MEGYFFFYETIKVCPRGDGGNKILIIHLIWLLVLTWRWEAFGLLAAGGAYLSTAWRRCYSGFWGRLWISIDFFFVCWSFFQCFSADELYFRLSLLEILKICGNIRISGRICVDFCNIDIKVCWPFFEVLFRMLDFWCGCLEECLSRLSSLELEITILEAPFR